MKTGILYLIFHLQVLNTSTSITLTPDDLLTLGYKRTEDGKLIKWADYWSLIVEVVETTTQDYLIHVSISVSLTFDDL